MQFPDNNLRRNTLNLPTTDDWLSKYLEGANGATDLARSVLGTIAVAIMSPRASMQCNAAYGVRSVDPENSRNGPRIWGIRGSARSSSTCPGCAAGTIAPRSR